MVDVIKSGGMHCAQEEEASVSVTVREKTPGTGVHWVFINYNGNRASRSVGSEEDANAVAAVIKQRLALGDLEILKEIKKQQDRKEAQVAAEPLPLTFAIYVAGWEQQAAQDCAYSTNTTYESIIGKHLLPAFGDKPMGAIAKKEIREFLRAKVSEGLNTKTVKNIKLCLSSILSSAVEDEVITFNPTLGLGKKMVRLLENPKGKAKRKVSFFTEPETAIFLKGVGDYYPRYYPFFLCAVRTGMRLGELIGLKPEDINFDAGYIEVRQAIVLGEETTPKNGDSRRVDVSKQLAYVLKAHLEMTEAETKERGWENRPETMFYNDEGEPIDPSNLRNRIFKEVLAKFANQLKRIRIHDLRHTYASALIALGESLKYIQVQLGHSSIVVTADIYGHLIPGANRAAVDKLDADESEWQVPVQQITDFIEAKAEKEAERKVKAAEKASKASAKKAKKESSLHPPRTLVPKTKKRGQETSPNPLILLLRGQDLNLGPSGYEPDELPVCSTPLGRM